VARVRDPGATRAPLARLQLRHPHADNGVTMPAPEMQESPVRIEVHDLASLPPALLGDWLALFDARPDAGFQHHPAWFLAIDRHLLPGVLRVGLIGDGQGLVAALVLETGPDERVARQPRHDHLPLGDVLIHPRLDGASSRRVVGELLEAMAPRAEAWRIADVPDDAALVQALSSGDAPTPPAEPGDDLAAPARAGAANLPPGWARRPSRVSLHFALTATDGREGHAVPGKLRRNLARLRRRLAGEGIVRSERVRDGQALASAWERFLEVESSGWKGADGTGTAIRDDTVLRGFYRALLDPIALTGADGADGADNEPSGRGGLRPVIDLLWLDEHCIAAQLGLEANGCLSLLKIGYDERHAACAPGSLLLEDALSLARDDGLHTLSLVTGPTWAERWHPERRTLWHAVRYTNSIGGRRRHAVDRLEDAVRQRIRR